MDSLKELIHPISEKEFFMKYWKKEHLVLKAGCNKCTEWMKNLYTWDDLNNYLNQYPDIKGLQILNYDDNDSRYCLDKVKNKKINQTMLKKHEVYDLWKKGKSFVIPLAEYQKEELVKTCFNLEQYFGNGCANVYMSPEGQSKSFPPHTDSTENFLLPCYGKTKWTIYKEWRGKEPKTVIAEYVLEPGDILYLPTFLYHKAESITPRISVSVHFHNKKNKSLKNFEITSKKNSRREKWYDYKKVVNENSNNK